MEWILFTIGILLGVTLGVIIMSLVVAGRYSDLDNEVISLRIQRNLLKEELLKQKPKRKYKKRNYKPRKKHKK
jgi:ABC-type lipoprotein release transport system permease subunit|tara:strand:- start:493 stop:711 length:219 start_codon:yes stop_codon:yes gene_type:complete